MDKPIRIYMGTTLTNWVVDSQPHFLRKIEQKYAGRVELIYPDQCVHRIFHDYARNEVVKDFLASDCDILWFLDSDVTPPLDVLDIVTEHHEKWLAAGAPYPVFMPQGDDPIPHVVFTVYREGGSGGLAPSAIPSAGIDWVAGVGTGCMFLKREVFERLEKPYFEFKFDPQSRKPLVGEDLGFCLKLKDLSIPFFVDFAKVCKHLKTVDLLDVNNYAMSYAKASVETYNESIKGILLQANAEIGRRAAARNAPKSRLILPGQ